MTSEQTPQFTCGPWEYKREFGREGLILTPEGEAVAAFMPDGVGNEVRMQANVRLIVAAPHLYEFVEQVKTMAENMLLQQPRFTDNSDIILDLQEMIKAANLCISEVVGNGAHS